jgi:hypothetical protein
MQAGSLALNGSSQNIVAPCACEGLRIYSNAFTFTFQFATRKNEVDPNSGVQVGQAVGSAISAEARAATDFFVELHAPLGNPFTPGEIIGAVVGHNTDVLYIRPIRPGGR